MEKGRNMVGLYFLFAQHILSLIWKVNRPCPTHQLFPGEIIQVIKTSSNCAPIILHSWLAETVSKANQRRSEACPRESKATIFTTLKTYSCHFFPLTSIVQNYLKEQAAGAINGSGVISEAALSLWEAEAGRLFKSNLGYTPSVILPKATQQGPTSQKERRDPEKVWWFERQ